MAPLVPGRSGGPPSTIHSMANESSGELLSYARAADCIASHVERLARIRPKTECVKLAAAAGRVLAQTLRADTDQPPFARSTRDGYACRAAEISTHLPLAVSGLIRAGDAPTGSLAPGTVREIMTGAPVPRGADAVAMIEHVESAGNAKAPAIRLLPPRMIAPGENIVARGAQARKGAALLVPGTLMSPAQIALAASCGAAHLKVYARPRVAILSTGDELVPIAATPRAGRIRNSSSAMLAAMVCAAGGDPWILPIARDTTQSLAAALVRAAAADLLLITGGVSAGKFDLVEPALARLGARFYFTGVRIQPGKPVVLGERRRSGTKANQKLRPTQCFLGLPGNPVSSAVTFLLFAAPMLSALAGRIDCSPRFALARLTEEIKTKPGLTRFLPATCTFAGDEPEVACIPWQGSGDLAAMARANCFLSVPEDSTHLSTGAIVRILLF